MVNNVPNTWGIDPQQQNRRRTVAVIGLCIVGILLGFALGYGIRQPEIDSLHHSADNPTPTQAAAPQTDTLDFTRGNINTIATQLEVFYNDQGAYPSLEGQLNNDAWATKNLHIMNLSILRPGSATVNAMQATNTPDSNHYGYKTFEEDGMTACTIALCPKFELYFRNPTSGAIEIKTSLN